MEINLNQLIRSAVVLMVGLPVSLAIATQATPEKFEKPEIEELRSELGLPCLKFAVTRPDSRGEREAKDAIDEIVPDADYQKVCKWVLG